MKTILPHDGEAVPQGAETLVDVVRLFLARARSSCSRPTAALAPGKVNHPQVGILAMLPDELDLFHKPGHAPITGQA